MSESRIKPSHLDDGFPALMKRCIGRRDMVRSFRVAKMSARSFFSYTHPLAKLIQRDAQRLGNADDNLDPRVANATFYAAQIGAINVGLFGEFIL